MILKEIIHSPEKGEERTGEEGKKRRERESETHRLKGAE